MYDALMTSSVLGAIARSSTSRHIRHRQIISLSLIPCSLPPDFARTRRRAAGAAALLALALAAHGAARARLVLALAAGAQLRGLLPRSRARARPQRLLILCAELVLSEIGPELLRRRAGRLRAQGGELRTALEQRARLRPAADASRKGAPASGRRRGRGPVT